MIDYKGFDENEVKFYNEEYPEMSIEDIIDILEALALDEDDEIASTRAGNFTNFINQDEEESSMKSSVLGRIFGK